MIVDDTLLDDSGRRILQACADASAQTGTKAWLVGGPVRDLLRGIPAGDLDLAVHGDPEAFVAVLGEHLSADVVFNERFHTWRLRIDASRRVDLARVRTETYPQPGALPVVEPASSIEEDLGRRDFTVNAMAIRIGSGTFGDLVDPFGGRADLEAGTLRILHPRSFRDDPTRILRALRLGLRCGLAIEAETGAWMNEAIRDGALATVTRERVWHELDIALRESAPVPVIRAFAARGCLTAVLGAVEEKNLARLPDNLSIPAGLDPRVILFGALTRACDGGTFELIPYDRGTVAAIRTIATREQSLGDSLAARDSADDQYAACSAASREERYLAGIERPEAAGVIERFEEALAVGRSIRGDALGVPPGPWIGRAIRDTQRAIFSGSVEVCGAGAFASRLAMRYLND